MVCTGPAGTPEAFDAVKQPGGAAALRLIPGSGVFVVIEAIDVATGDLLFTTPGFAHNGLTTVSCSVANPANGQALVDRVARASTPSAAAAERRLSGSKVQVLPGR